MKKLNLLFIFISVIVFSSCKLLNPSQMLRTQNYPYSSFMEDTIKSEYKIAPNDELMFKIGRKTY